MTQPNCLVFSDGDDWIVYAPVSHLVFRTNAAAARRFRELVDTGCNVSRPAPAAERAEPNGFPPPNVTIMTSNMCGQKCIYCYGTPAHDNRNLLDPDFCRLALEMMAGSAVGNGKSLRVFFHGVGEPTFAWPRFQECVENVRQTEKTFGVATYIRVCTGGQLSARQADWVVEHLDEVNVSFDGPRDIQNRQRPRRDGRDSFEAPLALMQRVVRAGKTLCVKTTVTEATVHRIPEIVEFVAREIGQVRLDLCMVFMTPWADRAAVQPPAWQQFVTEFAEALDQGSRLGVRVQHPTISYESLYSRHSFTVATHFCLAPPNIVTSFFDVPEEGAGNPALGAYGWFDAANRTIQFDHQKRRQLEQQQSLSECQSCPCGAACLGAAGVKGRVPQDTQVLGPVCQARLGVLRELLRRAVPRGVAVEEAIV